MSSDTLYAFGGPLPPPMSFKTEDLEVTTFHKSGSGFARRVEIGVRVKHIPTGLEAACDSKRSQHANREQALRMLCEKLAEQAPAPDYTKPEAAVQLDLHRRANFAREWPTMPRQLRVRLRELQRFPTENNHSSCSGFIAGYAAAQPGAFSDAYAQALAYALFCKDEWVHDEVKHASLLD